MTWYAGISSFNSSAFFFTAILAVKHDADTPKVTCFILKSFRASSLLLRHEMVKVSILIAQLNGTVHFCNICYKCHSMYSETEEYINQLRVNRGSHHQQSLMRWIWLTHQKWLLSWWMISELHIWEGRTPWNHPRLDLVEEQAPHD